MSALPQALPLAISASFYPPALLVLLLLLTGKHPRRLVLSYFVGAALVTISAGLIALALLNTAGLTTQSSSTASGWVYILIGLLLLALAVWAWRRKARDPDEGEGEGKGSGGRIAEWSRRATTSQKWAFVLGLVMFLSSSLYLLAVKDIADSGHSSSSNVTAVLICAIGVMLFVEIPRVAMFMRPGGVAAGIKRFHESHEWLKRNGWTLAAGLALLRGIYVIVEGIARCPDRSGQQGPRQRPVWAMIRPDFTAAASCW